MRAAAERRRPLHRRPACARHLCKIAARRPKASHELRVARAKMAEANTYSDTIVAPSIRAASLGNAGARMVPPVPDLRECCPSLAWCCQGPTIPLGGNTNDCVANDAWAPLLRWLQASPSVNGQSTPATTRNQRQADARIHGQEHTATESHPGKVTQTANTPVRTPEMSLKKLGSREWGAERPQEQQPQAHVSWKPAHLADGEEVVRATEDVAKTALANPAVQHAGGQGAQAPPPVGHAADAVCPDCIDEEHVLVSPNPPGAHPLAEGLCKHRTRAQRRAGVGGGGSPPDTRRRSACRAAERQSSCRWSKSRRE